MRMILILFVFLFFSIKKDDILKKYLKLSIDKRAELFVYMVDDYCESRSEKPFLEEYVEFGSLQPVYLIRSDYGQVVFADIMSVMERKNTFSSLLTGHLLRFSSIFHIDTLLDMRNEVVDQFSIDTVGFSKKYYHLSPTKSNDYMSIDSIDQYLPYFRMPLEERLITKSHKLPYLNRDKTKIRDYLSKK